jgi:hypothetical protein
MDTLCLGAQPRVLTFMWVEVLHIFGSMKCADDLPGVKLCVDISQKVTVDRRNSPETRDEDGITAVLNLYVLMIGLT